MAPHGTWLVSAILLFTIGVASSGYSFYKSLRMPVTSKEQVSPDSLEDSSTVLASLPVYRQDLDISISRFCVGITLGQNVSTVFTELKVWAATDLNIVGVTASITIDGQRYESAPVKDLSSWLLVEDFIDQYHRKNTRDINLGPLSLIKEIEAGLFKEGHHEPRWIAWEVPLYIMTENQLSKIAIAFRDKRGIVKKDTFAEMPKKSCKVIDVAFRLRE